MAAHQAPPSLGFSRQEHWSGLPFPSPMHQSEKWRKWKVKSLSRVWLLPTPWTAAYQAPPSMGFSRQEYWSGLPPLGHKSGIFRREKKGNTYATSTHFPCSLQNRSNCKTVLYLRDPQPATVCRPPMDTVAMQYHIGRPGVPSLSPGDQIYPSFSGCSSKEWGWNC